MQERSEVIGCAVIPGAFYRF